jgi:5'-deoxynucleotidase YfbR-like HD superfamily hydrolase/nucleoside phosphorylase
MAQYDIATIVALNEEFVPFSDFVGVRLTALPRAAVEPQWYEFHFTDCDDEQRSGIVAFIGDMGETDAALHTQALLNTHEISLIALIGYAGLVSDDLRLGQVVCAVDAEAYAYRGKWEESPVYGGRATPTTAEIVSVFDNFPYTHSAVHREWQADAYNRYKQMIENADIGVLIEARIAPDPGQRLLVKGTVATGPWVGAATEFKTFLKGHNRNYAVMEMETAAILHTAHKVSRNTSTLVLRAISDPGDERKSLLDQVAGGVFRKWSIQNAYKLFRIALRTLPILRVSASKPGGAHPPNTDLSDSLHAASGTHLPSFAQTEMQDSVFELYSPLLKEEDGLTTIEEIGSAVLESKHRLALRVDGESGVGQTGLLALLYWHLRRRFLSHTSDFIPIYIDVSRFDTASVEDRSLPWKTTAALQLGNAFPPFADAAEYPGRRFVLILDGISTDVPEREELETRILQAMIGVERRRVVGLNRRAGKRSVVPAQVADGDHVITMRALPIDAVGVSRFVSKYSALVGHDETATALIARAMAYDFDQIDCFTAAVLATGRTYSGTNTAAALLQAWSKTQLGASYDEAAALAFKLEFARERFIWDEVRLNSAWQVMNVHSSIRDLLVAEYVAHHLAGTGLKKKDRTRVLARLYPFRINRLCKDLINVSAAAQRRALETIRSLYSGSDGALRISLSYFTGRLLDREVMQSALKFLRQKWEEFAVKPRPQLTREELMFMRTAHVSLIRLGDTRASVDYIREMLRNHALDDLNRGFHLEYYLDLEYDTESLGDHRDTLDAFPNTLKRISDRIHRASIGQHRASVDIEIYTLASLAQHRHSAGRLSTEVRVAILETLKRARVKRVIVFDELLQFVEVVFDHLERPEFNELDAFEKLYRLKELRRTGWIVRGIENGETVSSHSFGAYLIALCLLPDHIDEEPDYSKERVLKMLLIHDLAEAYTGDLLPEDKTSEKRQEEDRAFGGMRMLSTYAHFGSLFDSYDLFAEYEARRSYNSRIAHDVDRLDIIFQLIVYCSDGRPVARPEQFRADLEREISTNTGRELLERIGRWRD